MKTLKVLLAAFLCTSLMSPLSGQVSFGESQKINENWKFVLGDVQDAQKTSLDDSKWQKIELPHDWSVKQQLSPNLASCTGFLPGGIGWYRKTLDIPKSKQGEKVFLYFEGVYNYSEVYVNGKLLGKRPNGYISFMYDATSAIEYGATNTIAVRVDHSHSADSRWYTGSGIYRNVWLVYSDPIHIAQWGVFAYPSKVTKGQGSLNVDVELANETAEKANLTVENKLYSPSGELVASSKKTIQVDSAKKNKLTQVLNVKNPQLWSLTSTNLYKLETTVLKDGKIVDNTTTKTGFRTLTFDANKGFALNGEWMKVKGVCLHHDAGVLGAAVPRDVWKRRLLTLKEIGVNAIRTSHNPQAPDLYELCDELGLLVLNESSDEWEYPKRKWIEGWNVGTPGFQGNFEFFKEWAATDLADLIRRDRNHISIFAWSIVNEVDYPNDPYSHPVLDGTVGGFTQKMFGGYKKDAPNAERLGDIAEQMVAVVKEYDKSRPVTGGLAGVAMSNETRYPFALDITGYNYTENRYKEDHQKYPKRVIFGSENRHDFEAWKAVADNEYIFGQFLWTGIDYLGESGKWPSRGFYSGLVDFAGFIKPRGYFRQSLWSNVPMAYLGTYPTPGRGSKSQMKDVWSQLDAENDADYEEKVPSMDAWPIWNYEENQQIRVVCYTNAAKAKLMLNGTQVGEVKNYDTKTGIIYWDIPYKKGKLEVIGLDKNGKEVSTYNIQSSERSYSLVVTKFDSKISKDKGVAHIKVQIVDENNVPVILGDNEITCQIVGPGKLLGLEAGNNSDMTDYTDNVHRAYHGKILSYVQATGQEGDIKIKFTSPLIKEAVVVIKVQ